MNHLWWIIPVAILLAALLLLLAIIVYEIIRDNRTLERRRRQLESAREEYPALLVTINQILTDNDPNGLAEFPFDFEYEYEAAGIICRLSAGVKVVDILTYLREEFLHPISHGWASGAQGEAAAIKIWDAWQEHLAREI